MDLREDKKCHKTLSCNFFGVIQQFDSTTGRVLMNKMVGTAVLLMTRFFAKPIVGETGVGCHTGRLSHCQYLIRWMALPCGDVHVTCA